MQEGDILDGRFELGRIAASGGMGVVFRATDRRTGALVAVKTLRGVEGAERFRREVQLLSALRHPAIVSYLGDGLPGRALSGDGVARGRTWRLAGGRRDQSGRGPGVGLQIASALSAAHAQGIVHRDIKPSNVFLADWRLDRVKLLDYGVARQSGSSTLTELGMVVGTPAYMAPEQARGERGIDARADVYALGALLFHCLTGRPPFEAEGRGAAGSGVAAAGASGRRAGCRPSSAGGAGRADAGQGPAEAASGWPHGLGRAVGGGAHPGGEALRDASAQPLGAAAVR